MQESAQECFSVQLESECSSTWSPSTIRPPLKDRDKWGEQETQEEQDDEIIHKQKKEAEEAGAHKDRAKQFKLGLTHHNGHHLFMVCFLL